MSKRGTKRKRTRSESPELSSTDDRLAVPGVQCTQTMRRRSLRVRAPPPSQNGSNVVSGVDCGPRTRQSESKDQKTVDNRTTPRTIGSTALNDIGGPLPSYEVHRSQLIAAMDQAVLVFPREICNMVVDNVHAPFAIDILAARGTAPGSAPETAFVALRELRGLPCVSQAHVLYVHVLECSNRDLAAFATTIRAVKIALTEAAKRTPLSSFAIIAQLKAESTDTKRMVLQGPRLCSTDNVTEAAKGLEVLQPAGEFTEVLADDIVRSAFEMQEAHGFRVVHLLQYSSDIYAKHVLHDAAPFRNRRESGTIPFACLASHVCLAVGYGCRSETYVCCESERQSKYYVRTKNSIDVTDHALTCLLSKTINLPFVQTLTNFHVRFAGCVNDGLLVTHRNPLLLGFLVRMPSRRGRSPEIEAGSVDPMIDVAIYVLTDLVAMVVQEKCHFILRRKEPHLKCGKLFVVSHVPVRQQ